MHTQNKMPISVLAETGALASEEERPNLAPLAVAMLGPGSVEDFAELLLEEGRRLTDSTHGFVCSRDLQTSVPLHPPVLRGSQTFCPLRDPATADRPCPARCGTHYAHAFFCNQAQDLFGSCSHELGRTLFAPAPTGEGRTGFVALAGAPRDYTETDLILLERLANLYALKVRARYGKLPDGVPESPPQALVDTVPSCVLASERQKLMQSPILASSPAVLHPPPNQQKTILFVDDEEGLRRLSTAILEYYGFRVLAAADGFQALELFLEHQQDIDIVLLDLTLPKLSGQELCQTFLEVKPQLPIVLMSGYTPAHVDHFPSQGIAAFISKPYFPQDLVKTINKVLEANALVATAG